jgi:hypothetical protein
MVLMPRMPGKKEYGRMKKTDKKGSKKMAAMAPAFPKKKESGRKARDKRLENAEL